MTTNYGSTVAKNGMTLCYDIDNPKSYSVNVHPYPLDIGSWSTTGNQVTGSGRDLTVTDSPVGGVPLKMVVTGSDPHFGSYASPSWNLAPAAQGQTWTISVYAKASVPTSAQIFMFGSAGGSSYVEAPATGINVTTSWQRFSFTYTFVNAATTVIQTRLDGPDSGFGTDGTTRPNIWWVGLQVERGSTATSFNPVTNINGNKVYSTTSSYNATINGYPVYSASDRTLNFNSVGSNDMYFQVPTSQARTVVILYKQSNTGAGWGPLWRSDDWKERVFPGSVNLIDSAGTYYYPSISTTDNVWQCIAYSYDSTKCRTYKNGVLVQEVSVGATWNQGTFTYYVGRQAGGSTTAQVAVDLKYLSFYDIALSDDEIKSTFDALRGRVGL